MRRFIVGSQDYYTASLRQLEDSRGNLFSEQEYRALRKETLDELATVNRRSIAGTATVGTMIFSCVAGGSALIGGFKGPLFMWLASVCVFGCGVLIMALSALRQHASAYTLRERLRSLHSLRANRLVTSEEFLDLRHRLELPMAA